jgi:hypothetical protein
MSKSTALFTLLEAADVQHLKGIIKGKEVKI